MQKASQRGKTLPIPEQIDTIFFPSRRAFTAGLAAYLTKLGLPTPAQSRATCNGHLVLFYSTLRNRVSGKSWPLSYGTSAGPTRHGVVRADKCGTRDLEFRHTPNEMSHSELIQRIAAEASAHSGDVTIVVGGFGNTHASAVSNAGALAHRAGLRAPVYVLDWPSNGKVFPEVWNYGRDRNRLKEARRELRRLLLAVLKHPDVRNVYLMAHSLGADGACSVISGIATSEQDKAHLTKLRRTALAAADMSETDFDAFLKAVRPMRTQVALLTCKWDVALLASRFWNEYDPVGNSSDRIYTQNGLLTIDASDVVSLGLGHSYIYDAYPVRAAIEAYFKGIGIPRSERRSAERGSYIHLLP